MGQEQVGLAHGDEEQCAVERALGLAARARRFHAQHVVRELQPARQPAGGVGLIGDPGTESLGGQVPAHDRADRRPFRRHPRAVVFVHVVRRRRPRPWLAAGLRHHAHGAALAFETVGTAVRPALGRRRRAAKAGQRIVQSIQAGNHLDQRRRPGRPPHQPLGVGANPGQSLGRRALGRIRAGQHIHHQPFPGGQGLQVHQHRGREPGRQRGAGVEPFGHRPAGHGCRSRHDLQRPAVLEEHGGRRRAEVRERHAHAAIVDQAHAREVLATGRQGLGPDDGVHGAVMAARASGRGGLVAREVEHTAWSGQAEGAGQSGRRLGRLVQPDRIGVDRADPAGGHRRGNGWDHRGLDRQRPPRSAAGTGVAAAVVDVARKPQRGGRCGHDGSAHER